MMLSHCALFVCLASAAGAEAGPACFWPLDDGRGAAARNVASPALRARLRGRPLWLKPRTGFTALNLDGRDDYVEAPAGAAAALSNEFTLTFWVAVRNRRGLAGLAVKPGALRLLYDAGAKRFLLDLQGRDRLYTTARADLGVSRWRRVALVRSAAPPRTELFVDGRRVARFDQPAGPLRGSAAPLRFGVGADLRQRRYLNGALARIRLLPRALTSQEIQAMAEDMEKRPAGDRRAALPAADARDSRWPLLLVDEALIAVNEGVSLTVCEAVKHPENPIIRLGGPGAPDELRAQFGGSVYYWNGKFRLWYWAQPGGVAYAESDDGIHWVKPKLGLVKFRGRTDNNLVPMPCGAMFYHDPSDPERPFKKPVAKGNPNAGGRHSLWTWAYSKDAFHWTLVERPAPAKWENAEAQMLTRVRGEWVIYAQGLTRLGRTVMAFHSPTLDPPPWEWKREIVWTYKDKYPLYQTHHAISPWPRPGLTIGLVGIFLDRRELDDTRVDLGLVLSRDGFSWWEPWPLATVLRRGNAGEWDSTFLIQGCPSFVNVRDKTYLYYSGEDTGNVGDRMQVGLAMLRRDGFGYQGIDIGWTYSRPGPRAGAFVTAPIRLHDKKTERVLLNVDNLDDARGQFVQVELLDADGEPIAGYTLAEADRMTNDGIATPATWRGRASLASVKQDMIRLRVSLHGGRRRENSPGVYAIYFYEPKAIEQ